MLLVMAGGRALDQNERPLLFFHPTAFSSTCFSILLFNFCSVSLFSTSNASVFPKALIRHLFSIFLRVLDVID